MTVGLQSSGDVDWASLTDEELSQIEAKELDTKDRKGLDTNVFAFPRLRKLPLNDASHVRNAMARFNQTQGFTGGEKAAAKAKIIRYARKYGIDVKDFAGVKASADPWTFIIEAVGLDLPMVKDHPNRMPFSGVLTKVGLPSDKAPNGTDGKKVLLTKEAVQAALGSLLGMGVDLAKDMDAHDVKSKVGVITDAEIVGNDLRIKGFIYAADFPQEALKIHMKQAQLGFSFEAQNIAVESLDADPLVVKSCVFTGAAILMKDAAAYHTTSLAAAAAKEHEMDEIKKTVEDALKAALSPITEQITTLSASQKTLSATVEGLTKQPTQVMANSIMCAKMEPHASGLEAAADKMEQEGVGLAPHTGHVHFARRLAASIRADAANGKVPHSFNESGSYWASQDPRLNQPLQPANVKDSPEYKALETQLAAAQAAADKATKENADAMASLNTKLADLTAKVEAKVTAGAAPDRKTLPASVIGLLSKHGIGEPEIEGGTVPIAKIDAALQGLDLHQRLSVKSQLLRAGVVAAS